MGKRKGRFRERREKKRSRRNAAPRTEARSAEAATVGWMLTTLATIGAEVIAGITLAAAAMADDPKAAPLLLRMAPGVTMFIAVATGLVGLALTLVVLRMRATAPPRPITVGAALINVSPLAIVALLWLAQALGARQ